MLTGEKIILRPLKIEDLEKTHEWRNNLELIKLTQGIRFPKTMEMDRDWFNQALNDKATVTFILELMKFLQVTLWGLFNLIILITYQVQQFGASSLVTMKNREKGIVLKHQPYYLIMHSMS